MSTPLPWITDRLPTEADGDKDGDVIALIYGDKVWCSHHWTVVVRGQTWLSFTPPTAAAEPTSEPLNQPRRFVSINRIVLGDGACITAAIADDGTAWWIAPGRSEWAPILPPLPPHYAPPRETHETHPPHLT